jgi:hypothetical protein
MLLQAASVLLHFVEMPIELFPQSRHRFDGVKAVVEGML